MKTLPAVSGRVIHFRRFLILAVLSALASVAFWACSEDNPGVRVANRHPIVIIKGGPLQGSTASYNALISWHGWDEDGVVTHYEYAIDPPSAFSQWEIANPERFPDIRIDLIPPAPTHRPVPGQDTLLVS